MSEKLQQFVEILNAEDQVLDLLIEKQSIMRKSVTEKNWDTLTTVIADINCLSEKFISFDSQREELQEKFTVEEMKDYFGKISELRTKLLKFKIENEALNKYVNITKDFIKGVIENAPQSGAKVYSKYGKIVQKQPQSVVLNTLY